MSLAKLIVLAVLAVGVSSRYVYKEEHPYYLIEEANILEDDFKDSLTEQGFDVYPSHVRLARQVGSASTNPDGSVNLNAKLPLIESDRNTLSAVVSGSGLGSEGGYDAVGAGLALDNVNGHGLRLSGTHLPKFGDQLSAAGRLNLLNTPDHNLNTNAFITRNMPNSNMPDFSTYGGSVDYMFRDKVGGSLGVEHTPVFQKTDYSAMANLNLFKDRTSSLDLNAGLSKSVSPFISERSWQPTASFSFTKHW